MTITEILKHGRENATRADVLAAKLGTTPRGLRRQIMQAREQGEIILYSPAATVVTSCRAMTRRPPNEKCSPSTACNLPGASTASPLSPLLPGNWAS